MRTSTFAVVFLVVVTGCASSPPPATNDLQQQVADTERAFARTMAVRDFAAFTSFISDEAIFFAGDQPLHGKREVAEAWRRYFETPDAPFSWQPSTVEVLDSGALALSSGPVQDAGGRTISTFTSIWRLEARGRWLIIFDKGNAVCDCAQAEAPGREAAPKDNDPAPATRSTTP
jgi:ketosteroid isomerase-like protein